MTRTLAVATDRLALHTPFRIARGTKTVAEVVRVTIGQGAAAGRGEGVPYARYDESVASVTAQLEAARGLIQGGGDRAALRAVMPAGAARNALDCALWDLTARLEDSDVATLAGIPAAARVASAITIVIDTPAAMAAAAAAAAHVPLLKMKVDAHQPAEQLRAVRAAAPAPRLIVDPNESWDRALTQAMQPLLAQCRADLLEQPVPAGDDAWLEGYDPAVPICADEAVHVAADLPRIARRYQAVNVKLDKAGGLTEALTLAAAARAGGLGVMVGCMVGSSLGIAPALVLAAGADFVDLDGPLWLAEDRPGGVRDDRGWLEPPAPGFWGSA